MNSVKIRVPASTTNLGPGFDSLGLALSLYNDFYFERSHEGANKIEVSGRGVLGFEDGVRRLIARTMKVYGHAARVSVRGIRVAVTNHIPIARGLGSSATYIVGTLVGLNSLFKQRLTEDRLLERACLIEGHPDNVVPALKGGFTVCSYSAEGLFYESLVPARGLKIWVASPEDALFTHKARQVLPKKIPLQDAVQNVGNTALLVASLVKGEYKMLRVAVRDTLHQPYRAGLIRGARDVLEVFRRIPDCGAAISGSGPSMLVLGGPRVSDARVRSTFARIYHTRGVGFRVYSLKVDLRGARVL